MEIWEERIWAWEEGRWGLGIRDKNNWGNSYEILEIEGKNGED